MAGRRRWPTRGVSESSGRVKRTGFLADDRARAGPWSTCAAGELLQRRGLTVAGLDKGCPIDAELRRFGVSFFAAVLANDVV